MERIKLLIVDDEADFRIATRKALERRQFDVVEAASGEQALERIRDQKFELVLLDLRMAGMGGMDTLTHLRKVEPELPVIILTGHGTVHDAITGIDLEIVDFVQKPVDIDLLDARIKRFLESGPERVLREPTIAEIMVSPEIYPRIYVDQPVRDVIESLRQAYFPEKIAGPQTPQIRSALVYDRNEKFLGLVRFPDLLRLALPTYLGDSPYTSYFTGMFLAQCKVIGRVSIRELMGDLVAVDVNAPLMKAVHLMLLHHLITLPVMKEGGLVGVLREKDIILEIANNVLGPYSLAGN
jgi:CheY-like chemotaxis protein